MKHKHYDMIVAKAANMDLVILCKEIHGGKWRKQSCQHDMDFDKDIEYFLCLPKHKEACLHWLNGGDVLLKDFKDDVSERVVDSSAFSGWHENTVFMSKEAQIRAKPKKEKRWILYSENPMSIEIFNDEEICDIAFRSQTPADKKQKIEIEVEV